MGFFGGFAGGFGQQLTNQIDQNRKSEADKQEALLETQVAPIAARLKDPNLSPEDRNTLNTQLMKVYGPQNSHKALAKMNEVYGISTAPPLVGKTTATPSVPIALPNGPMGAAAPSLETGAGPTVTPKPPATVDEILATAPKAQPKPLPGAKPYKDPVSGKFFISATDSQGKIQALPMPDNYTEKSHAQTIRDDYKTLTGKDLDATEDEAKLAIGLKPKTGGKRTAEEEKLDIFAKSLGLDDRSQLSFDQLKQGISEISKPKFKQSAEEVNKEIFARTIGKPVNQWTAKDLTRYENMQGYAKNPIGVGNLAVNNRRNQLMERSIDNAQSRSDLAGFQAINKTIEPYVKIGERAKNAEENTKKPSGPGDFEQMMTFVEATKPSSGFRFSDTEKRTIEQTRGLMDAAQSSVDKVRLGTFFGPEQREMMNNIIQTAAEQSNDRMNQILDSVNTLAPRVGGAVTPRSAKDLKEGAPKRGGKNAPATGGKKHSLKAAMALPFNHGKTEVQVRADLVGRGYEVLP